MFSMEDGNALLIIQISFEIFKIKISTQFQFVPRKVSIKMNTHLTSFKHLMSKIEMQTERRAKMQVTWPHSHPRRHVTEINTPTRPSTRLTMMCVNYLLRCKSRDIISMICIEMNAGRTGYYATSDFDPGAFFKFRLRLHLLFNVTGDIQLR